jgi:hypothetical protein
MAFQDLDQWDSVVQKNRVDRISAEVKNTQETTGGFWKAVGHLGILFNIPNNIRYNSAAEKQGAEKRSIFDPTTTWTQTAMMQNPTLVDDTEYQKNRVFKDIGAGLLLDPSTWFTLGAKGLAKVAADSIKGAGIMVETAEAGKAAYRLKAAKDITLEGGKVIKAGEIIDRNQLKTFAPKIHQQLTDLEASRSAPITSKTLDPSLSLKEQFSEGQRSFLQFRFSNGKAFLLSDETTASVFNKAGETADAAIAKLPDGITTPIRNVNESVKGKLGEWKTKWFTSSKESVAELEAMSPKIGEAIRDYDDMAYYSKRFGKEAGDVQRKTKDLARQGYEQIIASPNNYGHTIDTIAEDIKRIDPLDGLLPEHRQYFHYFYEHPDKVDDVIKTGFITVGKASIKGGKGDALVIKEVSKKIEIPQSISENPKFRELADYYADLSRKSGGVGTTETLMSEAGKAGVKVAILKNWTKRLVNGKDQKAFTVNGKPLRGLASELSKIIGSEGRKYRTSTTLEANRMMTATREVMGNDKFDDTDRLIAAFSTDTKIHDMTVGEVMEIYKRKDFQKMLGDAADDAKTNGDFFRYETLRAIDDFGSNRTAFKMTGEMNTKVLPKAQVDALLKQIDNKRIGDVFKKAENEIDWKTVQNSYNMNVSAVNFSGNFEVTHRVAALKVYAEVYNYGLKSGLVKIAKAGASPGKDYVAVKGPASLVSFERATEYMQEAGIAGDAGDMRYYIQKDLWDKLQNTPVGKVFSDTGTETITGKALQAYDILLSTFKKHTLLYFPSFYIRNFIDDSVRTAVAMDMSTGIESLGTAKNFMKYIKDDGLDLSAAAADGFHGITTASGEFIDAERLYKIARQSGIFEQKVFREAGEYELGKFGAHMQSGIDTIIT